MRFQRYRSGIIALAAVIAVMAVLCALKLHGRASASAEAQGHASAPTAAPDTAPEASLEPSPVPTEEARSSREPALDYALAVRRAFDEELAFDTGLSFNRSS